MEVVTEFIYIQTERHKDLLDPWIVLQNEFDSKKSVAEGVYIYVERRRVHPNLWIVSQTAST